MVLCVDTTLFKSLFPEVQNFIGNIGFGLSGSGELVRLYDNQMAISDSLVYDDASPWPTAPDGNGPTLSLKNPDLDNSLGENWAASVGNGTPGKVNDIFTDVKDDVNSILPLEYSLGQNYPNPFNPSTSIEYSVSNRQFVSLKIYDLLGKEVKTLVKQEQPAGFYEVEFNASSASGSLPSGVYLYRLIAGAFVATKKMIIIK